MQQLLDSRINKPQSQFKFESASPDKFGKGGYASLTYTPSKLANNVIYKEVFNMKRLEEGSSKVRESQALNSFLKDKLKHLQDQRDGIENSLTQQITMYKKMLHEMENTHEDRIRDLQNMFNVQIHRIIADKEEEARYVQAEKELLQNRIYELQGIIEELKEEINNRGGQYDTLSNKHQKLQIDYKHLKEKSEQLAIKAKADQEKALRNIAELNEKIEKNSVEFRKQLEKASSDAQKERDNLLRLHSSELQKLNSQRQHQITIKNQEIKDKTHKFQNQVNKLNRTIEQLNRTVDSLNNTLKEEREKNHELVQKYKAEIDALNSHYNRLRQEMAVQSEEIVRHKTEIDKMQSDSTQTTSNYEATISKLKQNLQLTQLSYVREKQRREFDVQDLRTQVLILRKNIEQDKIIIDQNALLCAEIRNLKDLLLESSLELQRCKEEFVRLAKDKDHLLLKLRELDMENQTLHRLKVEREEEAKGWRETYYMSRR